MRKKDTKPADSECKIKAKGYQESGLVCVSGGGHDIGGLVLGTQWAVFRFQKEELILNQIFHCFAHD